VHPADPILLAAGPGWASRGAYKLDAALERWGIVVETRRGLDAGASTGGFTDVLLSRGARLVVAVDVGRGQLLDRLRRDPRVVVHDRTNIRTADPVALGAPFDIVVADLSFISLRTVVPVLAGPMAVDGADLVLLVKPQFEAGREIVSKGRGVVRDPAAWDAAVVGVGHALVDGGAAIMGAMTSPLRGADGNAEFLLWARAHTSGGVSPESAGREAVGGVDA